MLNSLIFSTFDLQKIVLIYEKSLFLAEQLTKFLDEKNILNFGQ